MINLTKFNPDNLKDWHGKIFQAGDLVLVSFEKEYKYKDKTLGSTVSKEIVACQPWFFHGMLHLVQFDGNGYLQFAIPLYLQIQKTSLEKTYNLKNIDIKIVARKATKYFN